ncbi:MAG: methyl-accepting chemotaxis protein [Burkholderiales bacterium]|nr:methyl-accepting chemotaxis protein [Burkholderiales bacterium]
MENPFYKTRNIGRILTFGMIVLIVAVMAIAAAVYLQYRETGNFFNNVVEISEVDNTATDIRHKLLSLSISGNVNSRDLISENRDQVVEMLENLQNQQQKKGWLAPKITPEMVEALKKARLAWEDMQEVVDDLIQNQSFWDRLTTLRQSNDTASPQWVDLQREAERYSSLLQISHNDTVEPLEELTTQLHQLSHLYSSAEPNPYIVVAIVILVLIIIGTLFYIAYNVIHDVREREQAAESEAKRNQEAILKLLEETTKMADGDITVRATVDEAITGAIADALNFTLEEISALIRRINSTADQVANETESAQEVSEKLFIAAQQQSREIEQTANTVLQVTQSISEVADSAGESASVAQQSLDAAGKGAQAVTSQINSMADIRAQIQDTAKRIKRLGDSSLEIGEIVSMISDITDQTNVLALNAAIQAASAGEAGRGFAVVAEEVQRLAERSAEATKQIAAIVKTIQSDTQDAVSAMERSTSGVVEGTRLSEQAGEALADIERVTNRLAELIRNISKQTRAQAMSVDEVRADISKILMATEAATKGSEQTTVSINRLSQAAAELRAAVSGFKV